MRPRHRVVVIDDHDQIRDLLRIAIGADDRFEWVGGAANGADGVALISREQPDAVILDFEMPDIDGIEVLRTVRADGCTAVVVLYTAADAGPVALAHGADAAFPKGAPLPKILDVLARLADESD